MQKVNLKHYYAVDYWQTFWHIYRLLQRRGELQSLIAWSKKKRLPKNEQTYASLLVDEEQRFFRASLYLPILTNLAHTLFMMMGLITSSPYYYKGYAAKYKRKFLTTESEKTYS
jgi:hypothetical protein